jgi:S-formylglutathione hydrolase FrmB
METKWWQQPTQEVRHVPEAMTPPAVRGRWRVARAAIAAALVTALAVAGWAGALDRVPLLNGTVAAGVEATGAALLVASWWLRDRRWYARVLPGTLLAVGALVGVIAFALWVTETVTDAYPPSFALWVGTSFAAVATCPLVLRHPRPGRTVAWRKAAVVAAVPLTLAGAFLLIDQEYGIWPQIGDVLGHTGGVVGPQGLRSPVGGGGPPRQGVIVRLDAPATRSGFQHRPGVVFLPPAYFGPRGADLPVLVMLVGTPGTPINWLRAGHGQATDDAYAAAHGGVAPVLVVVDQNGSATADTECVDGPRGNAETYLSVDVPAFITGTLHIHADPARWGIVGFSEGGTCALTMVLRHPGIYRHIVDLGGDQQPNLGNPAHTLAALYGGDVTAQREHDPARLLATRHYRGVTAWFGAGVDDGWAITVSGRLAALTRKAEIPTHSFVVPGGHNWQFAEAALAGIFAPLCVDLGCVAGPSNAPMTLPWTGGLTRRPVLPSPSRAPG